MILNDNEHIQGDCSRCNQWSWYSDWHICSTGCKPHPYAQIQQATDFQGNPVGNPYWVWIGNTTNLPT